MESLLGLLVWLILV